jgi:hypothetical protein
MLEIKIKPSPWSMLKSETCPWYRDPDPYPEYCAFNEDADCGGNGCPLVDGVVLVFDTEDTND